jgi:hypothetical protein
MHCTSIEYTRRNGKDYLLSSSFSDALAVRSLQQRIILKLAWPSIGILLENVMFVCVQPYSTTLLGVPFPFPTSQGRWDGTELTEMPENLQTSLRPRFKGCARQHSGQDPISATLFGK